MNLKQQLKELKRKRQQEVRTLHLTYLQTKWDVKQAVSPGRLIRRHPGAAIALAAVGGILLAKKLTGRREKGRGFGSTIGRWAGKLAKKMIPGASRFMPDTDEKLEEESHQNPAEEMLDDAKSLDQRRRSMGLLRGLLLEAAMILLSRIDVQKIVADGIRSLTGWKREEAGHEGNGHAGPSVSAANAGTESEDPSFDV